MYYPLQTRRILGLVSLAAAIVVAAPLNARVGETQEALERRLLQPGVGRFYKVNSKDPKAEHEQKREEQDAPFAKLAGLLPNEISRMVYWKSAVATHLSNDEGWKLYVFYSGGRSSLEAYRRAGRKMSEFELKGILAANRGSSAWKKVTVAAGSAESGIGYDYVLEDGSVRALVKGDWVLVFSNKLDLYVAEQKVAAKVMAEQEAERLKAEQAQKAPESVAGF